MFSIVNVKKSMDIKNIKPFVKSSFSAFDSDSKSTTYNVECFTAVRLECEELMKTLKKDYPGYHHKIHAGYATSHLAKGKTEVHRLKLVTKIDEVNKKSHTNIYLLGPLLEPQPLVSAELEESEIEEEIE